MVDGGTIAWIIAGYIVGYVVSYIIARAWFMRDNNLVDIGLSVCISILWPGVLIVVVIGAVGSGIVLIIGKLMELPVQAILHAIKRRKARGRKKEDG